jgi:putative ABC transport system permease protein
MPWVRLALSSLGNRRIITALTVVSIALSVALLLTVENLREGARDTFLRTISGTDMIVGARSSDVPMLLYSVFHMGDATQEISHATYRAIAERREVDWVVPIALGDSHRGYRVVGTEVSYFERIRTGRDVPLRFEQGGEFADLFDAVVGAEVAERLNYAPGSQLIVSHGAGAIDFSNSHDALPFAVSGVLARTGTPIDRSVLIPIEAMHAIHAGSDDAVQLREEARAPSTVTAVFIGLRTRLATFTLQRALNAYEAEPLTAVLPGLAFAQLWSIVSPIEKVLVGISVLVAITAFLGLAVAILATLETRRREMAILRAVGAGPAHILRLFLYEAIFVTALGIAFGVAVAYTLFAIASPILEARAGLALVIGWPGTRELVYLGLIACGGLAAGLLPAWRAYRTSLADGLTVR